MNRTEFLPRKSRVTSHGAVLKLRAIGLASHRHCATLGREMRSKRRQTESGKTVATLGLEMEAKWRHMTWGSKRTAWVHRLQLDLQILDADR